MKKYYRHYKNKKIYEVIDVALHADTHDEMVVYRGLYHCEKFGLNPLFVRSAKDFFGKVNYVPGIEVLRFEEIESETLN